MGKDSSPQEIGNFYQSQMQLKRKLRNRQQDGKVNASTYSFNVRNCSSDLKKICFKTLLNLLHCSSFYVLGFWGGRAPGIWDLSSLIRDWTCTPCIGSWSPNHWTTKEVPQPVLYRNGSRISWEVHANPGFRGRTPSTLLWEEGQGTERFLQLLDLLEQLLTLVWKSLDVHRCQCALENRS